MRKAILVKDMAKVKIELIQARKWWSDIICYARGSQYAFMDRNNLVAHYDFKRKQLGYWR